MPTKVIVSYDGTANEDDAIALGRVFAAAGAGVELAYVRHAAEGDSAAERTAQDEAQAVVEKGLSILGDPAATSHVVIDRSTPAGLARLAETEQADVIVFCSDSHTARGHVAVGNSASRLMEGGRCAVAIAPVDFADRGRAALRRIVAVGEADGGALETASALAQALDADLQPVMDEQTDLLIIDSRADAAPGTVSISSAAAHLIEISRCAVLVLARGHALEFRGAEVSAAA
jgi:nucleotide-binding universal stress UspA family protein